MNQCFILFVYHLGRFFFHINVSLHFHFEMKEGPGHQTLTFIFIINHDQYINMHLITHKMLQ